MQPYDGKHLCEKPLPLLRHVIRTSTRAGDSVLDFTSGSCSTGAACVLERRNFIGIDSDAHWCAYGNARIKRAQGIACDIPKVIRNEKPMPLFEGVA